MIRPPALLRLAAVFGLAFACHLAPAQAWPTGEESQAVENDNAAFDAAQAKALAELRRAVGPDRPATGDLVPARGRAAVAAALAHRDPTRRAGAAALLGELADEAFARKALGRLDRRAWVARLAPLHGPREKRWRTVMAGLDAAGRLRDRRAIPALDRVERAALHWTSQIGAKPRDGLLAPWARDTFHNSEIRHLLGQAAQRARFRIAAGLDAPPTPAPAPEDAWQARKTAREDAVRRLMGDLLPLNQVLQAGQRAVPADTALRWLGSGRTEERHAGVLAVTPGSRTPEDERRFASSDGFYTGILGGRLYRGEPDPLVRLAGVEAVAALGEPLGRKWLLELRGDVRAFQDAGLDPKHKSAFLRGAGYGYWETYASLAALAEALDYGIARMPVR